MENNKSNQILTAAIGQILEMRKRHHMPEWTIEKDTEKRYNSLTGEPVENVSIWIKRDNKRIALMVPRYESLDTDESMMDRCLKSAEYIVSALNQLESGK